MFVHGASGGVGISAIQIAKNMGEYFILNLHNFLIACEGVFYFNLDSLEGWWSICGKYDPKKMVFTNDNQFELLEKEILGL